MVAGRITAAANPRVKSWARLKKAKVRAESGLFLIEGSREVQRALDAGAEIVTLLTCPDLIDGPPPQLPDAIETLELSTAPMGKIAMRQNPPGLIAVARQFDAKLENLELSDNPMVLIVEAVEKPGNLGAMLRTADAVGADAVIATEAATDFFNPNVVRASQGSLFSVPVAVASPTETIAWVNAHSMSVIGGYPTAPDDLWHVAMTGPVAVLVGAEDAGISAAWDGVAVPVQIPMSGPADSLNASVAAAVLLFEAVRQRRN